jgi:hypothetical protein
VKRTRPLPSLRVTWPALGLAFLAVLTVVLAQAPAGAVFSDTTSNKLDSVATAATFPCVSSGTASLEVHDTWTDQANPTVNHQGDTGLHVKSASGANAYTWLLFDTVPLPAHCVVKTAVMRLWNYSPASGRVISVHRASGAWSAGSIVWNGQPGVTAASPATSTTPTGAGWQSWNVLSAMQLEYSSGNVGFRVADLGGGGGTYENLYYDKNNASGPELVITWG